MDDGGEYLHNLTYSHLIGDARQSLTSIRDNCFRSQSQVQIQGLEETITYNSKSQNLSKAVTQCEVIVETAEI